MRIICFITEWRHGLGTDLFDELGAIHPDGVDAERDKFSCELPIQDSRVQQILACLTRHGCRPWTHGSLIQSSVIRVYLNRYYDDRDLGEAKALKLNPISRVDCGLGEPRTDAGRMILRTKDLLLSLQFGITGYGGLVASAAIKDRLEREGLVGVTFRPIELDGPSRAVASRAGRFWEVDSDVVLPSMSPRMRYYDGRDGREVTGEGPQPFVYREGPDFPEHNYMPPELNYTCESWGKVAPFDLARTCERPMGRHGVPIASTRLRRILVAARVRVAWVPVRVG